MGSRRRVVTGHDEHGAAIVASDEEVAPRSSPGMPGVDMTYLWGSDAPQTYPDGGGQPAWTSHFPPAGGFRFVVFSIPPAGTAGDVSDEDVADAKAQFPGLLETYDPDEPGQHTSDTTDVAIVLSGEIVLRTGSGEERTLRPGDTIVQNGTRHGWYNRTDERVDMLFVLVGADRS
jgi:quercetin dioxygenase-like cupin family protein